MPIDLDAYCRRIGHAGPLTPKLETLRALHYAHARTIPFENLDILLGKPIQLEPERIFEKLVSNKRGGYCFEQNALFALVLETIGFRLTHLCARVQMGLPDPRPRTHMVLSVELDDQLWLADVGFGGEGLLEPLRIHSREVARSYSWQYRVVENGGLFTLQSLRPEGWFDLYRFTLETQYAVDYEVANHYTSTYPASTFVTKLVAARPGPDSRLTLRNRQLLEQTPAGLTETNIPDDDALLEVLAEKFGLHFPAGTRFAYKD